MDLQRSGYKPLPYTLSSPMGLGAAISLLITFSLHQLTSPCDLSTNREPDGKTSSRDSSREMDASRWSSLCWAETGPRGPSLRGALSHPFPHCTPGQTPNLRRVSHPSHTLGPRSGIQVSFWIWIIISTPLETLINSCNC